MPLSWSSTDRQRLLQELQILSAEGQIWVAYSGGLDSTVLLHCLAHSPLKARVRALHINHGLSALAEHWQQHCLQQAQGWQVPLTVRSVAVNIAGDGLEQAAREARYQEFERCLQSGDVLVLGHHGDDQLETFVQRWLRGSGVQGLAAMRRQRPLAAGQLLRPLLSVYRRELEQYACQNQLRWIEDDSNSDVRLTRNWWRHNGLPPIWQQYPDAKTAALRTVERLQQDADLLTQLLQQQLQPLLSDSCWPGTTASRLNIELLQQQPLQMHSYLLRQWWQSQGAQALSEARLQSLLDSLPSAADKCPSGYIGNYRWQRYQQHLYLFQPVVSPVEMSVAALPASWALGELVCEGDLPDHWRIVAADGFSQSQFKPHGRPTKTLKKWWQQWQVPVWLRSIWPILVDDNEQVRAVAQLDKVGGLAANMGHKITLQWCKMG